MRKTLSARSGDLRLIGIAALVFLFPMRSLSATELAFAIPHSAEGPDAEAALASRGRASLSQNTFDAAVQRIPAERRPGLLRDAQKLGEFVGNLLLTEQLVADARAAGLEQDAMVQQRMALAARQELAKIWIDRYVQENITADLSAMAREYYQTHRDEFQTEETIDVTHLLVGLEGRDPAEARALIEALALEVRADPDRFDEVVRARSDDPGVVGNDGHYKGVRRGQMVKPFEVAAFALEPGQISEPVETRYGYHLIRLDDRKAARQKTFAEVREGLEKRLRKEQEERVRDDYVDRLRSEPLVATEEAVEEMASRYFEMPADEDIGD